VCRTISPASGSQRLEAEPHCDQAGDRGLGSLERRRRREPVRGRPQFKNLMFRRGNPPCFFAFDLLTYGKDLRTERLLDRKQELRRLLARACAPLKCTEYIDGCGMALFQRVCELDLEGIVAKQKVGPYVTEREHSTWFKIFESGIFTEGRQRRIVRA